MPRRSEVLASGVLTTGGEWNVPLIEMALPGPPVWVRLHVSSAASVPPALSHSDPKVNVPVTA
jgi:hypothetical protein